MSDQTGAIVWTANYKAWGTCKPENHTKRDIWNSEIITNNIRFQGQYYDDETGLHYNRYRYYSPYVGRFISKDPIGLLGGSNIYAYAPNPVGWIDPLGLTPKKKDCCEVEDPCTGPIVSKSTKQFGHAFKEHGKNVSRQSLLDRAKDPANFPEQLIAPYRNTNHVVEVNIPSGIGEVIKSDGTIHPATKMRVVPQPLRGQNGKNCIKTAYPIL